jgi:cellulose biosynthesis protein BcsQ
MLVDVWVTALLAFLFDAVAAPGVFFVRVERCLALPDPGSCCCCELLVAELFEVADISSCLLEPRPRLKLLPNTLDIQADDLLEAVQVNRELLLRKKLRPVLREFDVVVIDTPPAMRAATLNGLAVADTIVIPVDSSSFALLGLTQLLQVIAAIREAHKPDIVIRPLSTMFSRRQNLDKQIRQQVEQFSVQISSFKQSSTRMWTFLRRQPFKREWSSIPRLLRDPLTSPN